MYTTLIVLVTLADVAMFPSEDICRKQYELAGTYLREREADRDMWGGWQRH